MKQKLNPAARPPPGPDRLLALWPAIKGSLAEVRKPCIRPGCPVCARGDKHPNYLLSFTEKGRRRCLYVPKALVPALKRALQNGRQIEKLLYQAGPLMVNAFRSQYPPQTGPAKQLRPKKSQPKS